MINYHWNNPVASYQSGRVMEQDEITALGASLRPINQTLLTAGKEKGTTRIWYQGGEPYFDIFAEVRGTEIEWFQFTLRGQLISWNKQQNTWQTGNTNELRTDDITFYAASKVIELDSEVDFNLINIAQATLQTRAGEKMFDKMLALFQN